MNDFHNRESKLGYSALVTRMDHNIGRILQHLEKLGPRDHTRVVFSADQGHNRGHHGIWGKGNSTPPFNMYDGSLRVPLIWNQPGRIPAGKVLHPMVSSFDFFPTILDHLGVGAPADPKRVGRSYAGFVRGGEPRWRNEFAYAYVRGVHTENLKYIQRTADWPSELFDLETGPGEQRNVLADGQSSKQAAVLQQRLATFYGKAGAPPIESWRRTTTQHMADYGR